MARTPRTSRTHRIAATAYATVAITPAALLVIYLIGSLILSGGQVSDTMDTKWDAVVPYPLFVVPTVVLVALAILSVVLALVVVITARQGDDVGFRGMIGPTVAAIISAILLAGLVPDGGTRSGDLVMGMQWIAAPVSGAALVILLVGIAMARTTRSAKTAE